MCSELCSSAHFPRRSLLRAGTAGLFLSPIAHILARAEETSPKGTNPKSVILLWLEGGPSQLETFDPHPGTKIGGEVKAISTTVPNLLIADTLPLVAEQMHHFALLRAVTGKEGDHSRAIYNFKTGYRLDPTLAHPSIGAILCHEVDTGADIPRHISILPGGNPSRGGYLGAKFDAFKVYDPAGPIPDVRRLVNDSRAQNRVDDLMKILEPEFARDRLKGLDVAKTMHLSATRSAITMMSSSQLDAFDVSKESKSERDAFGDHAFGRGCLAAARLIEVGVRCVEVTLNGWDSHVNNHSFQSSACKTLDSALAALIQRLTARDLLKDTLVVCGGEFGRTPLINDLGGRDHWPHGFNVVLAGCGIRAGSVFGESSADPKLDPKAPEEDYRDSVTIADVQATILHCLGVQHDRELLTSVGRPMKFSEGTPIKAILG